MSSPSPEDRKRDSAWGLMGGCLEIGVVHLAKAHGCNGGGKRGRLGTKNEVDRVRTGRGQRGPWCCRGTGGRAGVDVEVETESCIA